MNNKQTEAPTDGAPSGLALATGSALIPEAKYCAESLREWVHDDFGPALHPVALTLRRSAAHLERMADALARYDACIPLTTLELSEANAKLNEQLVGQKKLTASSFRMMLEMRETLRIVASNANFSNYPDEVQDRVDAALQNAEPIHGGKDA